MTVPFMDLGRLHASIQDDLDDAIARVVSSSAFVGGDEVARFEEAFARAHGLTAGAGCGSGTDALTLTLRALGVGPGDEVIVPSMTFIATAEAVAHVGATAVIADVDPVSLLLDEASVDACRTERTRAILPVHLYGHLVPFDRLERWRAAGLLVVEDAAQAHLGEWQGERVGTVGHAACFSFYPGKNLGAFGDGGMVLSSDTDLLDEVRRQRDHGRSTKYVHDQIGWCSRLDGLQAAILGAKLVHLPSWTEQRRALAERYRARLGDLLVPWESGAVHHLLVLRTRGRDRVQASLRDDGIGTGIHYPVPLSKQPWLVAAGAVPTPAAEAAAGEILSLPMDPLMSDADVDQVVAAVEQACSGVA